MKAEIQDTKPIFGLRIGCMLKYFTSLFSEYKIKSQFKYKIPTSLDIREMRKLPVDAG